MTTATTGPAPDADLAAPLRTDTDVLRRVDLLLDEHARQLRSLVLLFTDGEGRQLPVAVPIDDVPDRPDPSLVNSVCWVIAEALAEHEGGRAVLVLTRPDTGEPTDADRRWGRLLEAGARQHRVSVRMICLATPAGVLRLSPDGAG